MNQHRYKLALFLIFIAVQSHGQSGIEKQIAGIAGNIKAKTGVYAYNFKTGETVSFNGDKPFPMQSVYKFPIAMAVLDKVDKGKFNLDEIIHIDKSEYLPINGHSPIRDKFPAGADLSLSDIIKYNIEESDGTACDVLLRLLGGTKNASEYVLRLGLTGIEIATTEMVQVTFDTIQYRNHSTPEAMTHLLKIFYTEKKLSESSTALLLKYMIESAPGANRIKGLLPDGTVVAHKTGTSGTINGLTRATNDAGIITLPDGNHMAITVFVSDTYANLKDRELTIAEIARAVYEHWTKTK